jgi:hypothetical protein
MFVAFYGHQRQSPMMQKPLAKTVQRRRRFDRGVRARSNGPLLPQILGKESNSCYVASGKALVATAANAFTAVRPECLDDFFINVREVQTLGLYPLAKMNRRV